MRPRRIEVHIEELVLRGFAHGDRYRIAQALEQELGGLIAKEGLPPSWRRRADVSSIDAGAFDLSAGCPAESAGERMVCAIYRGRER